jgi:hypothetical protein
MSRSHSLNHWKNSNPAASKQGMKGCFVMVVVAGAYVAGIISAEWLLNAAHPGHHPDTVAFIVSLVMILPAIVASSLSLRLQAYR